jgi:CheY-like chemotaxis protein
MLTDAQFVAHLRLALTNLYEPDRLRRSPLAVLFGVANRLNAFSALQRILTESIESLQPRDDEPHHPASWEIYELLFYRYVQQLNQKQVAKQLGMSVRHLRRKEGIAVEVLADHLWRRFNLAATTQGDADISVGALPAIADSPSVSEELAWLSTAAVENPCDLNQVLSDVVHLIKPLTVQHKVVLDVTAADLPSLAVHPVALSQLLLNLLTVAMHRVPGGGVSISARPLPFEVEILIQGAKPSTAPLPTSENDAASLDMAQQLAGLCGSRLDLSDTAGGFRAQLMLPAREQLPVLVIDDNADTLQLLRRYAADTRYYLITTQDPEAAPGLAQRYAPRIIVLDVMMPRVDGWKVLGQLRQHPLTEHIPVVVCTILAQEEMAFSLGASGFVRKPVTRQALLAALDQQVELMGTESR